ncbi:hypothetical protein Esi_0072_0052 [Ectocarpus siliculosus]|uniref:Uncharacterized protein n=1 Tax=Ectocarpus siliculosus TaxID=2880 RepID=D8LSE2_ECTSI|nr:hypothetical protein Esi_0072_0052 [Ectocarpus siliculosus]|eukprot:CBN75199.1 hypothetical protein Esi_0072_0052 [Ectocarpus siliculosus]
MSSETPTVVPASGEEDAVRDDSPPTGVSFWAGAEADNDANADTGTQPTAKKKGSETAVGVTGLVLPFKRARISASPATGLAGLLENELLGEFFGCLGFLSLATESIVRGAMVSVMRASNGLNQRGATTPARPRPATDGAWLVEEDDTEEAPASSVRTEEACWRKAVTTEDAALPRDASTCILWCAIALGALVRGYPLPHVGGNSNAALWWLKQGAEGMSRQCWTPFSIGYVARNPSRYPFESCCRRRNKSATPLPTPVFLVLCSNELYAWPSSIAEQQVQRYVHLATDTLASCSASAALDIARANLAMAFVHNFLGDQVKNHRYVELANSIVSALPPGQVSLGVYDLLKYAGKSWVFEVGLASRKDIDAYWQSVSPIWKLPEKVVEQDICGLVLAVDTRIDQLVLADAPGTPAAEGLQSSSDATAEVSSRPSPLTYGEDDDAEGMMGGFVDAPLPTKEGGLASPHPTDPFLGMKEAMPELLRANGLLSRNLCFLQALNNDIAASAGSFHRSVSALLRYPGLCRYNSLSHNAHTQLWGLANARRREHYEALRAAYNPMRPASLSPAPPFDEWTGMSDICDHPYCRNVAEQMSAAFAHHFVKVQESGPPSVAECDVALTAVLDQSDAEALYPS